LSVPILREMTMPRSLTEILQNADALAARFEEFEPTLDEAKAAVLASARDAAARKVAIERELLDLVRCARRDGITWQAIGSALGTSGEAARQRYSPLMTG
jgi:hypothetical protein